MNEQAVTETDTATQATEETDAQDLDQLLNEFDQETKTKEESETDEARQLLVELQTERTERDVEKAVNFIKEEGVDLPESTIMDMIYGRAARDPRFAEAFVQRNRNSDQFKKVLKTFAKSLAQPKNDEDLTKTRKEVVSAVSNASKSPAEEPLDRTAVAALSDADFNMLKRNLSRVRSN